MDSIIDRLERALQNRKEEQVIAAILHMSSLWGLMALISSGIVWTTSKTRSRFLYIQAMQAFLFQLAAFLAFGAVLVIYIAGFYYAMFSGLIAGTGAGEPELTSTLLIAAGIGFAAILFLQYVLPLWGIWAGIQTLRGRSFQYPILGKVVIGWTARQSFSGKTESPTPHQPEPDNGRVIAAISHASILVGFSLILSPILWAINRPRSKFLSHNLMQASIFQLTVTLLLVFAYFVICFSMAAVGLLQASGSASPDFMSRIMDLARMTYFPVGPGVLFILLLLTSGIYILIATVQAFRGKEFNYPFIGKWLVHYIQ